MHRKKLEQPLYVIISTSIGDLFAGFLTERKSQLLSPKTIRAYTQELTYFSDWLSQHGIQYVNEITAGVIRHYLMDLSERRNPGRCHIAYRVIKTSTFWWEDETDGEYVSPIRKVKPPKVSKDPLPGVLTSDIFKMIAACKTEMAHRDKAILLSLYDTGARTTEFISLNIADVNAITGTVWIGHGKGNKGRNVFWRKKARRALRSYLKTR